MFKLWAVKLKLLVAVVTPLDAILIGLTNKLWVSESNLRSIWVDVPIPTDWFGETDNLTTSLLSKPCAVETETTASILCKVPVTLSKLLSNKYSKLLVPTVVSPMKDNPSEVVVKPTWVTIPI